jgi:hypothetical protein
VHTAPSFPRLLKPANTRGESMSARLEPKMQRINGKMSCHPDPAKQCEIIQQAPLPYSRRMRTTLSLDRAGFEPASPEIVAALFGGPNESPKIPRQAKKLRGPSPHNHTSNSALLHLPARFCALEHVHFDFDNHLSQPHLFCFLTVIDMASTATSPASSCTF